MYRNCKYVINVICELSNFSDDEGEEEDEEEEEEEEEEEQQQLKERGQGEQDSMTPKKIIGSQVSLLQDAFVSLLEKS